MDNSTKSSGVSFGFVVFVVFLCLKLTDTIDWSWWWVTSPLWIVWAIVFGFMAVVGAMAGIALLLCKILD